MIRCGFGPSPKPFLIWFFWSICDGNHCAFLRIRVPNTREILLSTDLSAENRLGFLRIGRAFFSARAAGFRGGKSQATKSETVLVMTRRHIESQQLQLSMEKTLAKFVKNPDDYLLQDQRRVRFGSCLVTLFVKKRSDFHCRLTRKSGAEGNISVFQRVLPFPRIWQWKFF